MRVLRRATEIIGTDAVEFPVADFLQGHAITGIERVALLGQADVLFQGGAVGANFLTFEVAIPPGIGFDAAGFTGAGLQDPLAGQPFPRGGSLAIHQEFVDFGAKVLGRITRAATGRIGRRGWTTAGILTTTA